MRRLPFSILLLLIPGDALARAKNADLYSLYDVTRNSQLVVQGTIEAVDRPRQVVTVKVERLWHGKTEEPERVRYEVRGSLDPFRVGRRLIEFLDPNLPYGTQDPKTIMAPIKPRSPRNRVLLDDPASADYAAFVGKYLELTVADRGARVTEELKAHLVASLASTDARTRQAAGESLHDLLTLSDRQGKLARELLSDADRKALAAVLMAAEAGPGVPVMKLSMVLDEAALAAGMVHGSLYIPQSGIEARDSVKKALVLQATAARKAVRDEYAAAKTDGYREQLISVLAAVGGAEAESFLWELVGQERNELLRKEARLAHACLGDAAAWTKAAEASRKLSEADQAEMVSRLAACATDAEALRKLLVAEVASKRPGVRQAAAAVAARLGMKEAHPVLVQVLDACRLESVVSLACLTAMDGLRNLQTPDSIGALEKAAADERATAAFREDARRFLEDIRRVAVP